MSARLTAFVVWAAVAASAVFWLLRLVSSSPAAPSYTVTVATGGPPRGDLARVLGAPPQAANAVPLPTEPALASRFKLLGVAAPRQGGDQVGLALIAVDGKPARGYQVGAPIDGSLVLQSVHARGASLGAAGAPPQVTLELPPLAPPATSSRPPGVSLPPGAALPGATVMPPPGLPPPVAGQPGGSVGVPSGAPQAVQAPADGHEPQPLPAAPPNAPVGSSAR